MLTRTFFFIALSGGYVIPSEQTNHPPPEESTRGPQQDWGREKQNYRWLCASLGDRIMCHYHPRHKNGQQCEEAGKTVMRVFVKIMWRILTIEVRPCTPRWDFSSLGLHTGCGPHHFSELWGHPHLRPQRNEGRRTFPMASGSHPTCKPWAPDLLLRPRRLGVTFNLCYSQLVHPLLLVWVHLGRGVKKVSMCFCFPEENCMFHNTVLWVKTRRESQFWEFWIFYIT